MTYLEEGGLTRHLDHQEMKAALFRALDRLGPRKKVLALPPDFTRFHSQAGFLTRCAWEYYGGALAAVMPALGTHRPMTDAQREEMFGDLPPCLFRTHDWRNDVVTLGSVPSSYVRKITGGKLEFDWPVQVNRLLVEGGFDLILSLGEVVPHEVVGMANYNKNIFVGTGGSVAINRSHFIGAVCDMERIMGRVDTPVRKLFNYGSDHFGHLLPKIVYVQTVIGRKDSGGLAVRGLFIGDDVDAFAKAAALAREVNIEIVAKPFKKCVVYLNPDEFKSAWLGNKAIYRTRMAMADGGELLILAPGLRAFGEDPGNDRLIRKYGYFGRERTLAAAKANADLRESLGVAAHLIHGSSEGRFSVTYAPGHLTREEIESAGFGYADLASCLARYDPQTLAEGWNTLPDNEEIFYISNPALGLWAVREKFIN